MLVDSAALRSSSKRLQNALLSTTFFDVDARCFFLAAISSSPDPQAYRPSPRAPWEFDRVMLPCPGNVPLLRGYAATRLRRYAGVRRIFASERSAAAPSPRYDDPCMQASSAGSLAASLSICAAAA